MKQTKNPTYKVADITLCDSKYCWRCVRRKKQMAEMKAKGFSYFGQGFYVKWPDFSNGKISIGK